MIVAEEELIALVKERLGRFKAPKSVKLVEALPLSAVGKVVRRQVREGSGVDQSRRVS
jgi:acyl-coenzyme A synthetase/AMP-(fatty) acid ligase